MTEAVQKYEGAGTVAPLGYNGQQFSSDDVKLSRVYIAQQLSQAVDFGIAKKGDIYVAAGADDPEAIVIGNEKDSVLFHVLGMPFKRKSLRTGNELQSWDYNDPAAPSEAWTTYDYTIVLPEFDTELPYKFLPSRSNTNTCRRLNMQLLKAARLGPVYNLAFRMTTEQRQKDANKWHIAVVKQVEATHEGIAVAESLVDLVGAEAAPQPVHEGPGI